MKRSWCIGVALAGLLGFYSHAASAVVISVDLDPGTPGVQSTLTVMPTTTFTVDILLDSASPVAFDTVAIDVFFTNGGGISGFSLGPTSPIAGSLAGAGGSGISADANDFLFGPVGPGGALITDAAPAPAGTTGLGGVAYFDFLGYSVGPGSPEVILSVDLTASAAGSSTIDTAGIFGGTALSNFGDGVFSTHASGLLTVESVIAVPEPGTLLLFATGLLGIALMRRRWA